jgi:hypothetical protein
MNASKPMADRAACGGAKRLNIGARAQGGIAPDPRSAQPEDELRVFRVLRSCALRAACSARLSSANWFAATRTANGRCIPRNFRFMSLSYSCGAENSIAVPSRRRRQSKARRRLKAPPEMVKSSASQIAFLLRLRLLIYRRVSDCSVG